VRYFKYRSIEELRGDVASLGVDITLEEPVEAVARPLRIGSRLLANRLGIHPMEGCDGTLDGPPDELTFRRWRRFGAGGAALIWGEATAVVPEGRANPRQLWITVKNLGRFEKLVREARIAHREMMGDDRGLLIGLQLTHSGRYSFQKPMIAAHNPVVDQRTFIDRAAGKTVDRNWPAVTDDYLERLEDAYAEAAALAERAGFDFVDLKQCHSYLLHELLGARNRPGPYGGCFENRTRFARNALGKIADRTGGRLILASRINAYDGIPFSSDPRSGAGTPAAIQLPYEHGFGNDPEDPLRMDLREPLDLVRMLVGCGVSLLNVSLGSPYWNPHIGRPYERPSVGSYEAPEHPLVGVDRHFRATAAIQKHFPDLAVVGTGYSWLQRWLAHAAESNIRRGRVTIAAVGRGALAYPDFARDVLKTGAMRAGCVCLAVSFCSDLMRRKDNELGQFPTGCVPRDHLYAKLLRPEKSGGVDGDMPETSA